MDGTISDTWPWVGRLQRLVYDPTQKLTRKVTRAFLTGMRRRMSISDISRWRQDNSLHPSWEDRVEVMVSRIEPGSRILDIGAGAQSMRRHLPANCDYLPLDVVGRTPDTIVCDLNKGSLPSLRVDWAVASGVLEYLVNVPRFLNELTSVSRQAVISYVVPQSGDSIFGRRAMGWVNDFTQEEIEGKFLGCGFVIDDYKRWGGQMIYWLTVKSATNEDVR